MNNKLEVKIGEKAYFLDKEIKQLVRNVRSSYIYLAELLYKIKVEKLYEKLDYETFWAYVGQPEISLKRSTVYKLLGVYEKFVLEEKVPHDRLIGIDYNKLDMVKNKVDGNADEWIAKAESLSRSDLLGEIKGEEYHAPKFCPFCGKEVERLITKEQLDARKLG